MRRRWWDGALVGSSGQSLNYRSVPIYEEGRNLQETYINDKGNRKEIKRGQE